MFLGWDAKIKYKITEKTSKSESFYLFEQLRTKF